MANSARAGAVSARGATSCGTGSVGAAAARSPGSTIMVPRYMFIQHVKGYSPGVCGVNSMTVVLKAGSALLIPKSGMRTRFEQSIPSCRLNLRRTGIPWRTRITFGW
ncbi:MAG: hypothetical protein M5U10_09415 [Candidatus Methanoperedens sp.]|nr:hypothetical protein [Candidatus Methanoperedens nitroreducens]MDJ1422119.1 hypothetical protein [Candidatus Methanoperedens sp.]